MVKLFNREKTIKQTRKKDKINKKRKGIKEKR